VESVVLIMMVARLSEAPGSVAPCVSSWPVRVIGVRLVPLVAGHRVAGTTRSLDNADGLQGLGAEPVVVDAFDKAG
jgi:hypothetical protein